MMTGLLILLLIIAGIIIYKLNAKNHDDLIIKTNYGWKEKIHELKDTIKHFESRENELVKNGLIDELNENKEMILFFRKQIIELQDNINHNEQYLKEKGKN